MEGLDALKISEDKKKYIVDLLNPVLEEMVAECIHRMPRDPVPFMLEWLEQKKVTEEDKQLSPEQKATVIAENMKLEEEIKRVRGQLQECSKLAASDKNHDDQEEEDEDDDEPPPPDFENRAVPSKARGGVSAEAYGEYNKKKDFVAPVIAKTDEQKERLKAVLSKSFLFSSLEDNDFGIIIGAMKEVQCKAKQRVIVQGDVGDFLFVIESGDFDCIVNAGGTERVVKTCGSGDVFGELALLYNCPRAATVQAKGASVCWQLDRDTFNTIVKEAAQKKRDRYDAFLSKVPLLESMDAYERSQLADALVSEVFADGQTVMTQGEVGKKFYILEEGAAVAMKNGTKVMDFGVGDYFGELALITDQPRAATVIAKGSCKMLSVDSRSFKRLLNVNDLLERSNKYK
mmetsp:Transcript_46741/g.123520  ORF Transcript_46741/g.123520 Transcript_46741/m.123520 type:complete len:402 (-) Transcript_46741:140-1345(-)